VDNAGDVIEDTSGVNTIIATTSYILNGVRVNGSGVVDSDAIIIKGDAGSQSVIGNAKDNTLYGKAGNDMLTGGAGRDIFVFDTKPSRKTNFDTITDFNVKDDTIWLDNKYFKKLGKGSEAKPVKLNKAFFKIDTKAKDKNDYLVYNKKIGILYYDANGSGSNKAVEIARLDKGLKLSNNDFFVI
jgi:serralysin